MRIDGNTGTDSRRLLALVLVAYWALALLYTVSVPLGEAPDEVPHFAFVRYLAEKRALPVGTEVGSEGFQPPLYYAIGALAISWIPTGDFEVRANSDFSWDSPETSRNLLVHTKAEAFPYRGGALAWHIVRLLSILMGTITILTSYRIGREIFPAMPLLAVAVAAVIAFTPEFIFMSSVVNNDNLIAMLSALLMLKMITILKGAIAWRDFIQLGSLLGLSLIAKSSAIAFIPLGLIVLFSSPLGRRLSLLQSSLWSAVAAIFAFGFSGWWFVRNQILYSDPLGWSLKVGISDVRDTPLAWHDLLWLLNGLFQSFWGRFGGAAHLRMDFRVYAVLGVLVAASIIGGMIALSRLVANPRLRQSPSLPFLALSGLILALMFAALVRWTMAFLGTDQARLLYPALPSIVLFFLLGLRQLVPDRWHRASMAGLILALLTLAAVTPFAFINPVYQHAQLARIGQASSMPGATIYDFGGMARLVGYELDKSLHKPGETIQLTLHWQPTGQIDESLWLRVQLVDRNGRVVFQKEGCPSGGSYSADLWQMGETISARHSLRLSPTVPPDSYSLNLSMRRSSSKAWLPVFDRADGKTGDDLSIAGIRLGEKSEIAASSMQHQIKAALGGKINLLGYALKGGEDFRPGSRLLLTLYWQKPSGVELDTKLTVFTQLLDSANTIQAQADSQPSRGLYPTTVWEDNEVVADVYELIVKPQALPGEYVLIAGLYDNVTGKRLMVSDENGNPAGDFVRVSGLAMR